MDAKDDADEQKLDNIKRILHDNNEKGYRLVLETEYKSHRLDIIGIFVIPACSGISDPVSLT